MTRAHPAFDGDCDIAALVYGQGESPDGLLAAFAGDLRTRGVNVTGVLQDQDPQGPGLVFIPGGRILKIAACGCAGNPDAASWSSALMDAESWLTHGVRQRPDLLLLNRFGAAERMGGGLRSVISEAAALDIPLLLPVAAARFQDWLRFTEGLSARLECTKASLEAWWGSLSHAPRPVGLPTFCEQAK